MKKNVKPDSESIARTKILIVDDHPVICEGLTQIINREPDLWVCAEAGNMEEATNAARMQHFDLALVDILLDSITGIQVIEKLKTINPDIVALVFSVSDSSQYLKQAIKVGARGYITKDEISDDIIIAIRRLLQGHLHISKKLLNNITKQERAWLQAGNIQDYCA